MPAGQILTVLVCSSIQPLDGAALAGSAIQSGVCAEGQQAFLVPAYIPFAESQTYIDGLMAEFDPAVAATLFGFGWAIVVFFYLLGLKGSILLRPFWGGRY